MNRPDGQAANAGVVRLLGPQRNDPRVGAEVHDLAPEGPVATVTAGWRDREPDGSVLDELLGGRGVNLQLYQRRLDLAARDPELAEAEREFDEQLAGMRSRYLLRLGHALSAVEALQRLATHDPVPPAELEDAIDAVRRLDARHLERIAELRAAFSARYQPTRRPVVVEHREQVAEVLRSSAVLAVAGGHVDVVLDGLRRFDVLGAAGDRPIVAWSAGAMALTDRVVLFHDRAPQGDPPAEVHDRGLGRCRGIVVLPHAGARLRLDDHARTARFARRFAPARCLLFDEGARLADVGDPDTSITEVGVLDHDGRVVPYDGHAGAAVPV